MNRHPESTLDLATLLRWADRGRGWVFRDGPLQFKRLRGGAELIVVPPALWRTRVGYCPPVPENSTVPRALVNAVKVKPARKRA